MATNLDDVVRVRGNIESLLKQIREDIGAMQTDISSLERKLTEIEEVMP